MGVTEDALKRAHPNDKRCMIFIGLSQKLLGFHNKCDQGVKQ